MIMFMYNGTPFELYDVAYTIIQIYMLYVVCCMLYVAMLYVAMLYVAMLYIQYVVFPYCPAVCYWI